MRGNKMGPQNEGPKTGRGLGYCNGHEKGGYMSEEPPMGRGRFGRGSGRGMAFGRQGRGRGFDSNRREEELLRRIETLESEIDKLKGMKN